MNFQRSLIAEQMSGGLQAPPVKEVLRSSGQPLDPATRGFMESRLGHDFSQVRIHADTRAAESASAINARAYTVGRDVVFGTGKFEPSTPHGRHLLAHELTHVVQQRAGVHLRNGLSKPGDRYERQADQVANYVDLGLPTASILNPAPLVPGPGRTAPSLQKQSDKGAQDGVADDKGVKSRAENTTKSGPGKIGASVGANAENEAGDVSTVQGQLLRVGLLSKADFAKESPKATTRTIPESSLIATIAAIRAFQRILFGKKAVAGIIGPSGPTWRALRTANATSVAKMKGVGEKTAGQNNPTGKSRTRAGSPTGKLPPISPLLFKSYPAKSDKTATALNQQNLEARSENEQKWFEKHKQMENAALADRERQKKSLLETASQQGSQRPEATFSALDERPEVTEYNKAVNALYEDVKKKHPDLSEHFGEDSPTGRLLLDDADGELLWKAAEAERRAAPFLHDRKEELQQTTEEKIGESRNQLFERVNEDRTIRDEMRTIREYNNMREFEIEE